MFALTSRSAGVLAGWLADLVFADPRRGHPVAGFGVLASALERITYRDGRWAGGAHTGTLVAVVAVVGMAARRRAWTLAAATWVALGGTSLLRTVADMEARLSAGDVAAARRLLPSLCGREPDALDAEGLIRATLESLAENTSDASVAPLIWAAAGGAPAVLVYRAVNTLDAMIGYRSPRYARFGWAAARLDDAANYVPARFTAALVAVCAPIVGGSGPNALKTWRRDGHRHPSPNAGVVEAAFAGALGVRLGGPTHYPHAVEQRPALGEGPPPGLGDLRRALRLSRIVQAAAVAATVTVLSAVGRSGRPVSARR